MRKIEIIYDHKTANGSWRRMAYTTDKGADWERVVNIIHSNPTDYKVISVKHV